MISFTVGTTFLTHWLLGQRGHEPDTRLRQALQTLRGETYLSFNGEHELRSHCVYEVLDAFFHKLRPILTDQLPGYLTTLKDELKRTGSEVYSHPSFGATEEHAAGWIAIHQLHPHGQVTPPGSSETNNVFLPEFANRVEFLCFFSGFACRSTKSGVEDMTILDLFLEKPFQNKRTNLRVHLCDTLHSVYSRVRDAANRLQDEYANTGKTDGRRFQPDLGEDQLLIMDAHVGGFRAYRSLQRDFASIPPVGGHRLLVASAIRQGLGMPVVSETFPHDLWTPLPDPVKHFVLTAAEEVGKSRCEPLYPNVPPEQALQALNDEVTLGFVDNMNPDDSSHVPTLKMLGFGDVLSKRKAEHSQRQHAGNYASDWNDVGQELLTAIYGDEIEQSLHLQEVLDLYPLHKRVLGLVEYVILPKIKQKIFLRDGKLPDTVKGASGLWTVAFTGAEDKDKKGNVTKSYQPLSGATLQSTWRIDGEKATLETEGNWVLHAQSQVSNGPIDLAALLDGIVARMSSAAEVAGVSASLTPTTPREHAWQLAAIADRGNPNAAYMTLYLGKVALMLRNAVEHATDHVAKEGLKVDCKHYWDERGGVLAWDKNAAQSVNWREQTSLAALSTIPQPAEALLLTPASLYRCLVLLSLVMHAGFSQFRI